MGVDYPQEIQFIGFLIAVLLGTFWAVCFIAGTCGVVGKPIKIPERFDIGYIDDPPAQVVVVQSQPKPKKKHKPSAPACHAPRVQTPPEPLKTHPDAPSDDLLVDCVSALVGLGTKQTDARRVAAKLLASNPNVNSVEKFIHEVFKRK